MYKGGYEDFCSHLEAEHTWTYLIVLLGFPVIIVGPLICMGAASVLNDLCDKWELEQAERVSTKKHKKQAIYALHNALMGDIA
ncbi:unnamed protein product [Oikopleura dioica]|uniref:Uncharacterized protein n=1 Tax=Oikopleura dioica TaxID=34765 RepID=E4X3Q0_OIKDI|nr:unnamed protein product [Oikopleura dioica]